MLNREDAILDGALGRLCDEYLSLDESGRTSLEIFIEGSLYMAACISILTATRGMDHLPNRERFLAMLEAANADSPAAEEVDQQTD